MDMDTTKSTGLDGISPKMLKCTSICVVLSLSKLFKVSISTGVFPDAWKLGRITPIPKGTNSHLPSNYRPISVLSDISKLIEHHIKVITEDLLQVNSLISARKLGFVSR